MIESTFKLCQPLGPNDGETMTLFFQSVFDTLAMGNYPFSTYYIAGTPSHPVPAWPMRRACDHMTPTAPADFPARLLHLKAAIDVIMNASQDVTCYNQSLQNPSVWDPIWDYMVCTEQMINELPYFTATGWPNDMFPYQAPYTQPRLTAHCEQTWGKAPRYGYLNTVLGVEAIPQSSNIIFANGLLDPWHTGGVLQNISDTVLAYIIPEGAHHLDLFFSTPEDPASVRHVRAQQVANIRRWTIDKKAAADEKKH